MACRNSYFRVLYQFWFFNNKLHVKRSERGDDAEMLAVMIWCGIATTPLAGSDVDQIGCSCHPCWALYTATDLHTSWQLPLATCSHRQKSSTAAKCSCYQNNPTSADFRYPPIPLLASEDNKWHRRIMA
ncbi:unnamed protein product [Cylicocyclus nassatus]|uniref:Uncharacterized protein n=1 Tax=Cylicocyclus nassatus TaxID=53992 RepID=A0AA36GDZ8_CYLNA|nr:unnamed protein product [Cylicocyclus nassatus]